MLEISSIMIINIINIEQLRTCGLINYLESTTSAEYDKIVVETRINEPNVRGRVLNIYKNIN